MTEQTFSVQLSVESTEVARAVVVTGDGKRHTFDPLNGIELDPFNDPEGSFVQRCIICTTSTLPNFRAIYRPDKNSSREEWIFEYGDPWAASINDLPAYQVIISKVDGGLVEIDCPEHYWFSRWRWQSKIRPVRYTMQDLMQANLIPWLDATKLCLGPVYNVAAYTPMALCGIPTSQAQTGIYPGIGLITGWQAQYATRNGGEHLFRNQGEASGSVQWHVRDTKTNGIFNWLYEYPNANMYSASVGTPFFSWTRKASPDSGHHPSMSYVPYLLTGDPYYLEECQFVANHIPLMNPPKNRWSDKGRYFAWPLRSVAQAYLITPGAVPNWLMPRSHFAEMLKQNHAVAMRHVNDTTINSWNYVFHTMPDTGQSSIQDPGNTGDHVWQYNYTGFVLAWMVAAGFSEWRVVAEWALKNQVDRANGTSGYMRAYPSPYHIRLSNASALSTAMSTTDTTIRLQYDDTFSAGEKVTIDSEVMTLVAPSSDRLSWTVTRGTSPRTHSVNAFVYGKKHESWPEMMESNKRTKQNYWIQPPQDTLATSIADLTYPSNHRAALIQAVNAGLLVPGLAASSQWLDEQIRIKANSSKLLVHDNWAVVIAPQVKRRIPRLANATEDQD